jgi:hypothetical protein
MDFVGCFAWNKEPGMKLHLHSLTSLHAVLSETGQEIISHYTDVGSN